MQGTNRKTRQPLPPPRVIAVDVDGTLIVRGEINAPLVSWCRERRAEGYTLMLWSSRGHDHARRAAHDNGISDLFEVICSKPGYIVDDQGWMWTRYTRAIWDFCEGLGEANDAE